ncbi:50S ribosomal protein L34, chloroplastic [Rhodamnia argentea]|uniref:50S ribosomal protein L34, chloroplastic n=1 Tax=Rhodamnia argentea TaxID=178133 RepID=A0A8B8QL39_9MYRT|nr:50S ribosomal protein L34, chloroplastic [Rhodamnia argentea]XP_030547223.2 50S ribosomal protein L34, chloroplastic [Rhodamnia argentea]XP_030547224.2 50S ribosomal protein L34, chloroplastic [Rhodamnia argentea]XP_048141531.1 50S ribosomal protein L34, chloroplastic [Rhodamnia argentea]
MASTAILSSSCSLSLGSKARGPCASLTFLTGSRGNNAPSSVNFARTTARSPLLRCSFLPSSSPLSSPNSFSGSSLTLNFNFHLGTTTEKRRGLVVRAGKPALCLTKRNRSRKSLARTHGFRRRMRTTSGRAILKRRRAKGRWVLCPKSNSNSGKRS